MTLAALAAIAAIILFFTRVPDRFVAATIGTLWILVPEVALSGETHPAAILAIAYMALLLVFRPFQTVRSQVLAVRIAQLLLLVVVASAVLTTRIAQNSWQFARLSDLLLGPICLCYIVIQAVVNSAEAKGLLVNTITSLGVFEATLAFAQYSFHDPILYRSDWPRYSWYHDFAGTRWMGTLDHPLTLSAFLVTALILSSMSTWRPVAVAAIFLIPVGVITTGSRLGVVSVLVVLPFAILATRMRPQTKLALISALVTGVYFVQGAQVASTVAGRFANDDGSAAARRTALEYFGMHWRKYEISGGGVGSSFSVASGSGLATSFENPFVMYVVDLGLLTTLALVAAIVVLMSSSLSSAPARPYAVSAAICLLAMGSFSGLLTASAAAPFLGIVLGLCAAPKRATPRGESVDNRDQKAHATHSLGVRG